MATGNKPFNAVQMMRLIRDKLGQQVSGMTFEEEQAYLRKHLCDESMENIGSRKTPARQMYRRGQG